MHSRTGMVASAALVALVCPLRAQTLTGRSQPAVGNDEVRIVVMAAVSLLSEQIATAVFASAPRPWAIRVPDSSSTAWRPARDGLYTALRARAVTTADSSYTSLEFGPITIHGDTLVASFGVVHIEFCHPDPRLVTPAGWNPGNSEEYRVTAIRVASFWQWPSLDPAEIVDGGCMYKGKP